MGTVFFSIKFQKAPLYFTLLIVLYILCYTELYLAIFSVLRRHIMFCISYTPYPSIQYTVLYILNSTPSWILLYIFCFTYHVHIHHAIHSLLNTMHLMYCTVFFILHTTLCFHIPHFSTVYNLLCDKYSAIFFLPPSDPSNTELHLFFLFPL